MKSILKDDFEEFKNIFDIETNGNFINERDGMDTGFNIIYPKYGPFLKDKTGNSFQWMGDKVRRILNILLQTRTNRVRPETDTKVVASTNGMILSAFCTAYLATFDKKYKEASIDLFEFIKNNFIKDKKILRISYNNGKQVYGFLEDYANITHGILQYYRASLERDALFLFYTFMEFSLENFKTDDGSFQERENSLTNSRDFELYDGAIPSSNSIMLRNVAFFSLLKEFYDLSLRFNSFKKDFVTSISTNSTSYSWLITVLYEIRESIVIKLPESWITNNLKVSLNLLLNREKILKKVNSNSTEICTISECLYKFLNQKEELEILKKL